MIYVIIVFGLALTLQVFLWWCRKGHGGRLGKGIRISDHIAWEDAVDKLEREIYFLDLAIKKGSDPGNINGLAEKLRKKQVDRAFIVSLEPKLFDGDRR